MPNVEKRHGEWIIGRFKLDTSKGNRICWLCGEYSIKRGDKCLSTHGPRSGGKWVHLCMKHVPQNIKEKLTGEMLVNG